MNSTRSPLPSVKHTMQDVVWLSSHESFVQAAKRLGEVLYLVEKHLQADDRALEQLRLAHPESELQKIRKEHQRLLRLVQAAQAFVSHSDPSHAKAYCRQLARAVDRHRRLDRQLLSN